MIDIGTIGDFTWHNYGKGLVSRKARVDRYYASQEFWEKFIALECRTSYSTTMSDHYPIAATFEIRDTKKRSNKCPIDPSFLKI